MVLTTHLYSSFQSRHSVCLVLFIVADTVIKKTTKNRQGCALPKGLSSVAVILNTD